MFPKSHIIFGLIFSFVLYLIFPSIGLFGALIVFLASVLIDVDHYLVYVCREKCISINKAYCWHLKKGMEEEKQHKRGIRKKGHFHILHTIEIHILLIILSFFSIYFFYILIGFVFHSLFDLIDLTKRDMIYRRYYSIILYLFRSRLH